MTETNEAGVCWGQIWFWNSSATEWYTMRVREDGYCSDIVTQSNAACGILNSNADQMLASFKRFHFRLLANEMNQLSNQVRGIVDPGLFEVLFVQQWSSTFIDGSFRFGMKTPMEQKPTPAGCELRFRPVGTPTAKTMEELDEGRGAAICHLVLRKLSQDCFLNLSAMVLILCSNDAQSTLKIVRYVEST